MAKPLVVVKKNEHIAGITLNNPGTDDVVNLRLGQELGEICEQINQDDDIYVVTITGTGDIFFAADKTSAKQAEQSGIAFSVSKLKKPVVAVINGNALGQGLELALACDIRIASQEAHFGFPGVAEGVIPTDGGTQRLPRIIGRGKALELILTGEIIDAAEALKIGLVSKVVPLRALPTEADTLAKFIAGKAPIALRYIKEAVNDGLDLAMEQGLRLEADLYFLLHTTEDRKEGIRSFLQKRPPGFKGK
ncbi:MAG: enoyl-CoA hydratase/isomerase family protein [Dehalococcoidales bacterium]|nr:enoyl-CoA hydratase/isomerase family protein [Dehalococcoidales bacterium]